MFCQLLISGLTVGSLYALIGLGFVIIYKATNILNIAQEELLMLGAFMGHMPNARTSFTLRVPDLVFHSQL